MKNQIEINAGNEKIREFIGRPVRPTQAGYERGSSFKFIDKEFISRAECVAYCDEINIDKHPDLCYYPAIAPSWPMDFSLKYHESWDWLMPVIEKIGQYVYEVVDVDDGITKYQETDRAHPRTFGLITDDQPPRHMFRFNRSQLHYGDSLIAAAYAAVVQWINDYNEGLYTPKPTTP